MPEMMGSLSLVYILYYVSPVLGLAQDADVLVHEATNTFLPGVDKEGSVRLVTRDTKIHGHSTPFMVSRSAYMVIFCDMHIFSFHYVVLCM